MGTKAKDKSRGRGRKQKGQQRGDLLRLGNSKLGDGIYTFSLPPVETCPGATPVCLANCYARRRRFRERAAHEAANLRAAQAEDFEGRLIGEIRRRCVGVIRMIVSGDFATATMVRAFAAAAAACPDTRFYGYTRSWRIPELLPELVKLSRCRNVRLWFSCDRDTGIPAHVPRRVKLAYMQAAAEDVPGRADLVFRVHRLRKTVAKRIGLTLVCPVENGATGNRTDCGRCQVCIK